MFYVYNFLYTMGIEIKHTESSVFKLQYTPKSRSYIITTICLFIQQLMCCLLGKNLQCTKDDVESDKQRGKFVPNSVVLSNGQLNFRHVILF